MGGPSQLPPTPDMKRENIDKQVSLNKNEFEHRGSHTVKAKAYDPSYKKTSFSVKENFYGAKLNTSQLQDAQPNDALKKALRLKYQKKGTALAAGTPSRARITMNQH